MIRDERIMVALDAARRAAARLGLQGADADEAEGVALAALVIAADKFDPAASPTGEAGWLPFAVQRVKWGLADWGRGQLRRRPVGYGEAGPGADPQAADPADLADAAGRRPCSHCKRVLPPDHFYPWRRAGKLRPASWCKVCVRALSRRLQKTPEAARQRKARRSRPEGRERILAADRERAEERKPRQKTYRANARAKLLHCRRQAGVKLRKTTDPVRRAALERLIAGYTAEIGRMDARKAGAA